MKFRILFLCLLLTQLVVAQNQYKVACIGFYNFENLFDTIDDPAIQDEEYTPKGSKQWTEERYNGKIDRMAKVMAQLGTELLPDGISILGVAEIENRNVLEDIVRHEKLRKRKYQVIHYDSPDKRGIDVALLYQPKYYQPTSSRAIPLLLFDRDSARIFTRDILFVSGLYDGEALHILVNHWPSRRGGERATSAFREAGAAVCKGIVDSLVQENPDAKILIMGDFNDEPVNKSLKKILKCQGFAETVEQGGLFNPMMERYKNGHGTLAYRDAWSLFDQIIVSEGLLNAEEGYNYGKVHIFKQDFMLQQTGRFKGYPLRTHAGSEYLGGYSDHFPVYVFLKKKI